MGLQRLTLVMQFFRVVLPLNVTRATCIFSVYTRAVIKARVYTSDEWDMEYHDTERALYNYFILCIIKNWIIG